MYTLQDFCSLPKNKCGPLITGYTSNVVVHLQVNSLMIKIHHQVYTLIPTQQTVRVQVQGSAERHTEQRRSERRDVEWKLFISIG